MKTLNKFKKLIFADYKLPISSFVPYFDWQIYYSSRHFHAYLAAHLLINFQTQVAQKTLKAISARNYLIVDTSLFELTPSLPCCQDGDESLVFLI